MKKVIIAVIIVFMVFNPAIAGMTEFQHHTTEFRHHTADFCIKHQTEVKFFGLWFLTVGIKSESNVWIAIGTILFLMIEGWQEQEAKDLKEQIAGNGERIENLELRIKVINE